MYWKKTKTTNDEEGAGLHFLVKHFSVAAGTLNPPITFNMFRASYVLPAVHCSVWQHTHDGEEK